MTREIQTIWRSDDGVEVLRHKTGETFYIPLGDVTPKIMRELMTALQDALSDPLVQAVNQSKQNGK